MSTIGSEHDRTQRTDCDELRDLLPAYVVGATTPEETARVRALLPACPEVAEELADYGALSSALVESVDAVQPPAHLKASLMARLADMNGRDATPLSTPVPTPVTVNRRMPEPIMAEVTRSTGYRIEVPRIRISWLLTAAALIALVVTNVSWMSQSRDRESDLIWLQGELARANVQREDALALMSSLQTQRIGLQSTSGEGLIPLATIYWNPATNEAALVTDQLPPLNEQQTYQLWLINDAGPQSAGTFNLDANGFGWLVFDPGATLEDFDALGISVEPQGGSDAPTTTPLAVGQVSV